VVDTKIEDLFQPELYRKPTGRKTQRLNLIFIILLSIEEYASQDHM